MDQRQGGGSHIYEGWGKVVTELRGGKGSHRTKLWDRSHTPERWGDVVTNLRAGER